MAGVTPKMAGMTPKMAGMTPKMAGMTPKMAGMTPGTMSFSPALLSQSPSQLLYGKHRSPAFNSPDLAGLGGGGVVLQLQMTGDESRKRDLGDVLRLLAMRPGRISEEGVERLAKRMGLDCYKDKEDAHGVTTVALAAKIFLLDIDFKENKILRVALSFANTPGLTSDISHLAAAILQANLSPPAPRLPLINPSLADFADNLERLTKIDRLSFPPGLNCFTAITGLYKSLLKVYEHEKGTLEGGYIGALCKGNGRPRMHARGKVGLSVEYWKSNRFPTEGGDDVGDGDEDKDDIWRMMIEVEEIPSPYASVNPITPVRTSDHWVSDEVKKPSEDSLFGDSEDTVIDWLEPPIEEVYENPSSSRPLFSRFVARLDPPVTVPFRDELQLLSALMLSPPTTFSADTLESVLFPGGNAGEGVGRRLFVPTAADELEEDEGVRHKYMMHSLRPVYARQVFEVPFSHPKELAGVMHILRQFAFVESLLKGCFSPATVAAVGRSELEVGDEDMLELDSFLAGGIAEVPPGGAVLPVDISVAEQESGFGIGVIFPQMSAGRIIQFSIEVGRNGDTRVLDLNADGGKLRVDPGSLEWALAVGSDLGVITEWLRRKA